MVSYDSQEIFTYSIQIMHVYNAQYLVGVISSHHVVTRQFNKVITQCTIIYDMKQLLPIIAQTLFISMHVILEAQKKKSVLCHFKRWKNEYKEKFTKVKNILCKVFIFLKIKEAFSIKLALAFPAVPLKSPRTLQT